MKISFSSTLHTEQKLSWSILLLISVVILSIVPNILEASPAPQSNETVHGKYITFLFILCMSTKHIVQNGLRN